VSDAKQPEDTPIVVHPEVRSNEGAADVGGGFQRNLSEAALSGGAPYGRKEEIAHEEPSVIPSQRTMPTRETLSPPELAAGGADRAVSLDALRGLFIVLMTLSFTVSRNDYPAWMYHRQLPPPAQQLVDVAGITWVDLIVPGFIFAMAAAIPLALSRRIANGETEIGIILAAFRRAVLLVMFALLVGHSNTFFLGYTQTGRALGIAGFAIMFLVFVRRRSDWNPRVYRALNSIGWIAAIAFLILSPMLFGKGFSFEPVDDVIISLAAAAVFGTVIWYFTRDRLGWRFVALAIGVALYLGAKQDGWVADWWGSSMVPWLIYPGQLTLLTMVIPGTIVGDLYLEWMHAGERERDAGSWDGARVFFLGLLCLLITPIVVVGLYERWVPQTTQVVAALLLGGWFLTWDARTSTGKLIQQIFRWGSLWLLIGLFLEPFEGGIKKEPETLTYYFTVTGCAMMLLVTLSVIVEQARKTKPVNWLVDVGRNPMVGYVLFTILINPLLELIPPLRPVLNGSVGEAFLRGVLSTALVVVIVRALTKRRIFWRT
jgi:predicted acyltransferase